MKENGQGNVSERITQPEIERLLVLRQEASEARTTAAKKQRELEAEEERLMAALKVSASTLIPPPRARRSLARAPEGEPDAGPRHRLRRRRFE